MLTVSVTSAFCLLNDDHAICEDNPRRQAPVVFRPFLHIYNNLNVTNLGFPLGLENGKAFSSQGNVRGF